MAVIHDLRGLTTEYTLCGIYLHDALTVSDYRFYLVNKNQLTEKWHFKMVKALPDCVFCQLVAKIIHIRVTLMVVPGEEKAELLDTLHFIKDEGLFDTLKKEAQAKEQAYMENQR